MAQRILIAWEDERSRSDLARQLEERGYTVLTLSPDAEWLSDLLRSSVDVLVIAPGAGVERVSRILERTDEPRTTIVVRHPTALGESPEEPLAPLVPVAPVVPVAPEDPAAPVVPVVPEDPAAPVVPVVPEDPAVPVVPLAPVVPVVPAAPVAPVVPVVPVVPVAPEDPAVPAVPAETTPLLDEIEHALTERRLRLEIRGLRALVADRVWNGVLAGTSPAATRLRRDVEALESSTSPAILVGPLGSGRRFVARAIHLLSARAGGPLHEIDCEVQAGGYDPALLSGREDGPGRHRPGWIERTHGGTLTLLGLGRLGHEDQLALATFLHTGRIHPTLGPAIVEAGRGHAGLHADVRILGTLTRDPDVEVSQGWLSPAIRQAMGGIVVRVPSLSERLADLPELVDVTLRHLGADGVEVTPSALRRLEARPWRGNLAELELVLGRALLRRMSRQRLDLVDIETS